MLMHDVRLIVTLWYSVKTVKRIVKIISTHSMPIIFVALN